MSIMSGSRFSYWHAVGACMVPVAVVAASLLTGGVANSAPPGSTPQATEALAPTTTGIALAVSPVSPVAQGALVTLTATITPLTAVGTVQFKDGTTDIDGPVTVSNNGTASGSTSLLVPGSHQLTAVFTPANPATFIPSTSSAVPLTVTGSGAGMLPTGAYQQSGLSLDVQLSVVGDQDNQVVVLDGSRCSPALGISIPVLDGGVTILDRRPSLDGRESLAGRPSVLDGNGLVGGVVSVVLGLG
jgi:hypothetical protein